jgi:DnaJ family protein C protein 11
LTHLYVDLLTFVCRQGLVILSATYGPECRNVAMDVTVPVQALVHNSQVYVPGHRTKVVTFVFSIGCATVHMVLQAGIQGFYDPAPTSPKSLRVRYLFGDRPHYVEIPDYVPVVLPMRGLFVVLVQICLLMIISSKIIW